MGRGNTVKISKLFLVCVVFVFGIIIVCFALIYLLSKPLFLRMISTPFEFKKNESIRKKKNRKNLKKEICNENNNRKKI